MLSDKKYHHILDYNVTNWLYEKNENNFLLRTFIDKDEKQELQEPYFLIDIMY